MLNFYKLIEILVTIQTLIISTMLPAYISLPFINQSSNSIEIPITWQIPTTILLTLVFNRKVLFRAFTIYVICGLLIFPVFHHGGSIGYLLTPYFGYLLGTYPLIRIIDNLNKKNKINIINFLINGFLAIIAMHLTGIFYNLILLIFHNQFNIFLYNLGKYYVGNIGYHLIMLIPLILVIRPINYLKYNKK
tara:strand:- start:176 stop:748 length:573 start_codon:yes stop_codon:yes gene_type:complete